MSEALYFDLRSIGSKLGVSLFLPGVVATRILDAERNRPRDNGSITAEAGRTHPAGRTLRG